MPERPQDYGEPTPLRINETRDFAIRSIARTWTEWVNLYSHLLKYESQDCFNSLLGKQREELIARSNTELAVNMARMRFHRARITREKYPFTTNFVKSVTGIAVSSMTHWAAHAASTTKHCNPKTYANRKDGGSSLFCTITGSVHISRTVLLGQFPG